MELPEMKRMLSITAIALTLGAAKATAQNAHPAAPAQRPAVRVQMMMQGSTYKFEPANFTVHVGDVVEFVNVSGFPHNVSFEAAKIPAGAAAVLNAAMANRTGNLQGPMFTQAGQTYRVSFAGAPVGTYDYFCLPHKPMGMKGTITVAAAGARGARH
jgi:plastocyanin